MNLFYVDMQMLENDSYSDVPIYETNNISLQNSVYENIFFSISYLCSTSKLEINYLKYTRLLVIIW